jgi:hypothetical protein
MHIPDFSGINQLLAEKATTETSRDQAEIERSDFDE